MSTKLLHCPFCGPGNSMVDPWFDDLVKAWRVGCGACGASTGFRPGWSEEDAISAWNKRDGLLEVGASPDWKELALYLLNCTAATAEGFPKSVSKSERRRHSSILTEALRRLDPQQPIGRAQDYQWVCARALAAIALAGV